MFNCSFCLCDSVSQVVVSEDKIGQLQSDLICLVAQHYNYCGTIIVDVLGGRLQRVFCLFVFVFSRLLLLSCLVKLNVLFWLHLFKVQASTKHGCYLAIN